VNEAGHDAFNDIHRIGYFPRGRLSMGGTPLGRVEGAFDLMRKQQHETSTGSLVTQISPPLGLRAAVQAWSGL